MALEKKGKINGLHGSLSQSNELAEEQLRKTINELVATEENFVKDIRKLVDQYLKPTNLPILQTAGRLLRVQTSFLFALRDAAGDVVHKSDVPPEQLRDSLIRVSTLFINKCNKFKIYSDYSAAYLRFQQNKKPNRETEELLNKNNLSGEQSDSAQSLLIKPIQRVLKYPLFIQQIKDNCLNGSVEKQQAEQALRRMHALADYVNEMQRITEQYGPIIDEISMKHSAETHMNLSELLMFANVNWLNYTENRSRPVACVAFVFSSLIFIYCPSLSKHKNRLYRILPINEIEVNENITNSKESQILFVLIHIKKSQETIYHFCCFDSEIKNHFIKSIRKAAAASATANSTNNTIADV
ncbi:unnamed protein product [Dracunculus medinensis]|uniref:DH domain-containing protein n=1 Tax=Dracunculus medinensis TaxID=318479 RepID=A0A0N4U7H5_DRAME|nr:unnamed protein product [Dracunculus medinensis]